MRYLLISILFGFVANATLSDSDKQVVWGKNLMLNGGFENGKGSGVDKWTASAGAFSIATSGSNLLDGKVSFTWDAAAANDTLSYGQITVPNGLKGKNGVFALKLMTPSGTATHSLQVTDGTNVLGTVTIASMTSPQYNYINFIWPSSGYVVPRLLANANEPSITGDSAWIGDAEEVNLTNITQAQFIGSAYIDVQASCASWSRTNTALGAFAADTDCTGPVVEFNPGPGAIQTTDADLPQFTVNNLPPGNYRVVMSGPTLVESTTNTSCVTVSDGTTTSGRFCENHVSTSAAGSFFIEGNFNYTTAANRTFQLYGSASTGSITARNSTNTEQLKFAIYRHPLASEQAYKPSQSANSWSGYHDSTCSWARTNTAFGDPTADATCTLTELQNVNFGTVTSYLSGSDKLPGIVFTPSKAQRYFVCAHVVNAAGASNVDYALALLDDSTDIQEAGGNNVGATNETVTKTLCGIVNATSTAAKTVKIQTKSASSSVTISAIGATRAIGWTIFAIDQSLPSPLLVGSTTTTSTGSSSFNAAVLNCDSGAAITSQLGSWVSSIGNISAGACAVTLTTGVYSATPYCIFQGNNANPLIMMANATSATAVTIDCDGNDGTDCTTYDGTLMCLGAK